MDKYPKCDSLTMSPEPIPPSIKSPFSLNADYADPKLYGWGSVVVGVLALVVGILASVIPTRYPTGMTLLLLALGAILLIAGLLIVRRGA